MLRNLPHNCLTFRIWTNIGLNYGRKLCKVGPTWVRCCKTFVRVNYATFGVTSCQNLKNLRKYFIVKLMQKCCVRLAPGFMVVLKVIDIQWQVFNQSRTQKRNLISLSVYLSICLSVFLSICLSVYISNSLFVRLHVCLSISLSVCLPSCLPAGRPVCAERSPSGKGFLYRPSTAYKRLVNYCQIYDY